jgi:hypothetical protein
MTTPIITELPLHLEPTTADPFIEDTATLRELDHRRNDGIDVALLWDQTTDRVLVAVSDARTGDAFELAVEPGEAHDAFDHPYAHAAARGIPYRRASPQH